PSFPLTLFAIPDPANETNRFAIEVPYLGSLILTHSLDGAIKGLKEFKPEDRPPVAIPFFAFRVMVGIGFLMLAVVAASWWLRYRGRLFDSPWFLWLCMAMGPLGFIAVLAGWTTTEVGRQPWILRAVAHRRLGVALARGRRRAPLLAGLHGGLSDHLPVRGPHRGGTGAQGPGVGARDRRAGRERAAACADPCRARAGRQDAMNALNFVPVWTLILGGGAADAKKSALLRCLGNVLTNLAQPPFEGRCIAGRLGIDYRTSLPQRLDAVLSENHIRT